MKLWFQRLLYKLLISVRPHTSRTVRVAFPVMLLSVALMGAATITSDNSSYLVLETNRNRVTEGEEVSIVVSVYAHVPVNAVDLAISFPASELKVRSVDTGESVLTIWTEEPYVKGNTAYLSGGTFRKGFTGEHVVARINAIAQKSGVAEVTANSVRLLAGDGAGTEIAIDSDTGNDKVRVWIATKDGEIQGEIDVNVIITDIDGDGEVDLGDISRFMAAWFNKDKVYDFNGDGQMTFTDFSIILADSFNK